MARITGYTKEGLDAELDRRLGGIQEGCRYPVQLCSVDRLSVDEQTHPHSTPLQSLGGRLGSVGGGAPEDLRARCRKILLTTGTGLVEWANISTGEFLYRPLFSLAVGRWPDGSGQYADKGAV